MQPTTVLTGNTEYEQFGYDFDLSNQPDGLVIAISSITKDAKLDAKNDALEVSRGGVVNLFSLKSSTYSLIATLKSDRSYSSFGSKVKVSRIEKRLFFEWQIYLKKYFQ